MKRRFFLKWHISKTHSVFEKIISCPGQPSFLSGCPLVCFLSVGEASIVVCILPRRKRRPTVSRPGEKSPAEPQRGHEVLMAQPSHQTAKPHCFPFRCFRAGLEKEKCLPRRAEWWFTIHSPGHSVKRSTDAPALNCGWKLVIMCWTHWSVSAMTPELYGP